MIKVMTPVFRVSFPQLFEAKAIGDSTKKKYGLVCLFTMAEVNKSADEKKKWDDMIAACKKAALEKWPKELPKNLTNPFRKGEEKEQFGGYGPGVIFISASTMTRPGLVGPDLVKIINPEEFYAGCYARATVNPFAWTFAGKNGVSFGLQNVQKVRDGEPFGGRTNAEEDFDAAPAEDVSGVGAQGGDVADALFR